MQFSALNVTEVSAVQPENARLPIEVTEPGIVTEASAETSTEHLRNSICRGRYILSFYNYEPQKPLLFAINEIMIIFA